MTAKRKKQHMQVDDGRDKPDYAADLFRREDETSKKNKRSKPQDVEGEGDATTSVAAHLGDELTNRLREMKAALSAEEPQRPKTGIRDPGRGQNTNSNALGSATTSRKSDGADKDKASFAELFNPAPEDEESFEEMLKSSKLDWKKFKD